MAVAVAEAVNYLHNECSRPVIHRDIKSSNILLSNEFQPQVCFHLYCSLKVQQQPQSGLGPKILRSAIDPQQTPGSITFIIFHLSFLWK